MSPKWDFFSLQGDNVTQSERVFKLWASGRSDDVNLSGFRLSTKEPHLLLFSPECNRRRSDQPSVPVSSSLRVASVMRSSSRVSFVADSTLAAVLTVLPMTVKSSRAPPPIVPASAGQ
jgi:hypothetical protein